MTTYRITIDRSLCSGFGSCVELAPEAYELGPDGIANALVHETDDPDVVEAAGDADCAQLLSLRTRTGGGR